MSPGTAVRLTSDVYVTLSGQIGHTLAYPMSQSSYDLYARFWSPEGVPVDLFLYQDEVEVL